MKILIVGSGGREHALAWSIARSPRVRQLWVAPGNGGTSGIVLAAPDADERQARNVPIAADNVAGLSTFAREQAVDLVVVGPEIPLAAGLVDALEQAGVRAFGPSKAAATLEGSKAWSKAFMQRHGIPTARFATFEKLEEAIEHLSGVEYPVVIKASGLAAGKGVILPETAAEAEAALRQMMVERVFGSAGDTVVIEERLSGPEVSLMAFVDGTTAVPMPPAQDHKRVGDGDTGPNTGGMGAICPTPACPPSLVAEIQRAILQPTVDAMRAEGTPYRGVLYAGLMLTERGPMVLEFNCRFGDPETEVVLPLLESDLVDVCEACATGTLARTPVRWSSGACATVVLASKGYPGSYPKGVPITGIEEASAHPDLIVFHAGTRRAGEQILTDGGRVLAVSGLGPDLASAIRAAYAHMAPIHFAGVQFRRDIGAAALRLPSTGSEAGKSAYAASGVDITAGNRAVDLMRAAVKSTYGPEVLAGIGAFGGMYDARALREMKAPVLVASTDGVGTKVKLAAAAGRYEGIGHDLVNHCINDILVQGARPLFFLDYFATSRLDPTIVARVVGGLAAACREAGMALLGGETAEMPGVYLPGEFDLAGTIVGVVARGDVIDGHSIQAGDVLLGLGSSGPHTNGYSLIRRVFEGVPLDREFPGVGVLADALLAPHRSYLAPVARLRDAVPVRGLAHLTGGGFIENIPRILPSGLAARVRRGSWPIPPLFQLIQERGGIAELEMHRVFNLGIGMIAVVAPEYVEAAQKALGEPSWIVGTVTEGDGKVELV